MTKIIVIFAAAIVAAGIIGVGLAQVYKAGQEQVRQETLKKAISLVQERDKLNVQVRNATAADICRRLGGVMQPDGECG